MKKVILSVLIILSFFKVFAQYQYIKSDFDEIRRLRDAHDYLRVTDLGVKLKNKVKIDIGVDTREINLFVNIELSHAYLNLEQYQNIKDLELDFLPNEEYYSTNLPGPSILFLQNLASAYLKTKENTNAIKINNKIKITYQNAPELKQFSLLVNSIAWMEFDLLIQLGRINEAESLGEMQLNLEEKDSKLYDNYKGYPNYNPLIMHYIQKGDKESALRISYKSIDYFKSKNDSDNVILAYMYANVGEIIRSNSLKSSTSFYEKALNIYSNEYNLLYDDSAPLLRLTTMSILASNYLELGDTISAIKYTDSTMLGIGKCPKCNYNEVGDLLTGLSISWGNKDSDRAIKILLAGEMYFKEIQKDLPIESKARDAINFNLMRLYEQFALMFSYRQNTSNELYYAKLAHDYAKNTIGLDEDLYYSTLSTLASAYQSNSEDGKALDIYLSCLKYYKKKYGENHYLYISHLLFCSIIYSRLNDNQNSLFYIKEWINRKREEIIISVKSSLTQLESVNIPHNNSEVIYHYLPDFASKDSELVSLCYDNLLLTKGLQLRLWTSIKDELNRYPHLKKIYEEYSKMINNIAHQNTSYADEIYKNIALKEQTLIQSSSAFSQLSSVFKTSWKTISKALGDDEVAIEIGISGEIGLSVNNNIETHNSYDQYFALLISKNCLAPIYIPLFTSIEYDRLYATFEKDRSNITSTQTTLYSLVLEKIAPFIAYKHNIFISPAGVLHFYNLPISSLTEDAFKNKNIHLVSSTTDLLDQEQIIFSLKKVKQLIGVGGINYGEQFDSKWKDVLQRTSSTSINVLRTGVESWSYLPGSLKEVNRILAISASNNIQGLLYKDAEGSEANLKKLSGQKEPFILHLATHGYFVPSKTKEKKATSVYLTITQNNSQSNIFSTSENPLMRTGIILSGANKVWRSNSEVLYGDSNDGILTALEISNLDLSNCQLVVLSACETGLGELNRIEGVYGLQRAFKMAGVKNIIMSLWKVPDKETAELFEEFYKKLFSGLPISDALRQAQLKMKEKYPPYYWAGFKLLE